MVTIGLLYSCDDHFSLLRSEMLVGPMLMANVKYIRFLESDIDSKTLRVSGEYYHHSKWVASPFVSLDVILDFSISKQARSDVELALLSKTPHSLRIDLDSFELLNIITLSEYFQKNIPKQKKLYNFEDILDAEKKYKTFVIKNISSIKQKPTLIISKEENIWLVCEPYESYKISTDKLKELLKNRYNGRFFIQEFIESKAYDNRALMFKIIVQQRFDGAWVNPIVRGVISDGPLASISSGGEAIGTPLLEKDGSYIRSKKRSPNYLNLKIQRFSVAIAQYLREQIKGSPSALELNVVFNSDLIPQVLSINGRANAPSMPGRTIEFYRHLTDFAIGLSKKNPLAKKRLYAPTCINNDIKNLPLLGTTIKTIVIPENIKNILNPIPLWLDLSIGYGGRTILSDLDALHNHSTLKPYFSLRIGNAQNDILRDKKPPLSIIAIEEYIGTGIINYKEAEYMRSLRVPLLQKQFEQAKEALGGTCPNIVFLDDIDLGAYGLSGEQLKEELSKTVDWFEQLCASGGSSFWGITLYNCRSRVSNEIINILNKLCSKSIYYKYIATSLTKIDEDIIDILKNSGLKNIILSKNLTDKDIATLHFRDIHVLKDWNEINVSKLTVDEEK